MLISRVLIEVPTSGRIPDINFINLGNNNTSKCMHGMNQTEAEYSRHGKRSQRASLSQIGPVVLEE